VPVAPPPAASQPASQTAAHASPAAQTPAPQAPAGQTPAQETAAPEPTIAVPSTSATGSDLQKSNRYQINKAPEPEKKAARPKKPAPPPAASAPAPSVSAPAPAPAAADPATPAPKLGDILTADEQKQYNASIDQSLAHAQTSLSQIEERHLTPAQADEVEQIASFIKQAQAARAADLTGAKSLAERAEVLAKDLAAALR
jgi:hypothetical protein